MKRDSALIFIVLLIVVASAFGLYYTFRPYPCAGYECFQQHMATCSSAHYVNEEPEASWEYVITRRDKSGCEIKVKLLQAKQGDLKLRDIEGDEMLCKYNFGVVAYPDKDLSLCHGLLKEDLQGIIIEKLHAYLVDNLANVKDALNNISVRS